MVRLLASLYYTYTLNELAHQYSNYDLVLYIIGAIKQSVIFTYILFT